MSIPHEPVVEPVARAHGTVDTAGLDRFGAGLAAALAPALAGSASPERALVGMLRLLESAPDPAGVAEALLADPRLGAVLATLFGASHYLSQVLLRHPEQAASLASPELARRRPDAPAYLLLAEQEAAQQADWPSQLNALRALRDREQLRTGCADLLGLWDLVTVTEQLSSLADGLIRAVLALASRKLGARADGLAVLALGKLGGGELNYSSDIDLVFVADGASAAHDDLARAVVDGLGRATDEGYLYRVDLRLRPWGRSGPLVADAAAYLDYLRGSAALSERQALLKARPVAGDLQVGSAFLAAAEPILYGAAPEASRDAVARTKREIEHRLEARDVRWGEVKQGAGSIRDVEFVTQFLQLREGGRLSVVRGANTLQALARLHEAGVLPDADYRTLVEGYAFLRPLEHALQLLDYRQAHTLPRSGAALGYLARRLGFRGEAPGIELVRRYEEHTAAVRAVYDRYLRAPGTVGGTPGPDVAAQAIQEHIGRMARTYGEVFGAEDIARHVALARELSDNCLAQVDATPLGERRWRVQVVARDFAGELSAICGLMLARGLEIEDGQVFTSAARAESARAQESAEAYPRMIVDAFTVRSDRALSAEDWECYAKDLRGLLAQMAEGHAEQAHGELARRVAEAVSRAPGPPVSPLSVVIENPADDPHTVVTVEAPDARGFLYELSAALALGGYRIIDVTVRTVGTRAQDVLHITDAGGRSITDLRRQEELRATVIVAQHFCHLLPASPDPERALRHFRGFLARLFAEPGWSRRLSDVDRPEVLTALARLLGVSDFLWEDLFRVQYDALLPVLRDVGGLAVRKDRAALDRELAAVLDGAASPEDRRRQLNTWRDREMFRVDMRHIQGHIAEFGQFSEELGDLAEAVLAGGLRLATEAVEREFGAPRDASGERLPVVLCGLGKLGGREMGYASDVELLFVHDGRGSTDGSPPISSAEFHERTVAAFLGLVEAKRAGIFQVDLRLRPYGSAGSLAVSLDGLRRYYAPEGPAWPYERQAMVKLRPFAGDPDLAERIRVWRDEAIFGGVPVDGVALRAMRERQLRHIVGGGALNAKYGVGGLVDVEYLVQALQMRHGARLRGARSPNTLAALAALIDGGVVGAAEGAALREAYRFLRQLIDALRMVRGNAQDLSVPSEGSEEWLFLARRMGGPSAGTAEASPDGVRQTLETHMATVARVSRALLERDVPGSQPEP